MKKRDDKKQSPDIEPPNLDPLTPELQVALPRNWPAGVAAVLALVVIAWLLVGRGGDPPAPDEDKRFEKILHDAGVLAKDQSLAVYSIAWKEQQTLLTDGLTMLDAMFREWKEHQQKLAALLDSADGQRIAGDPALVDQFAAIQAGSGPTATLHANQHAQAAAELQLPIDEARRAKVVASPPEPTFIKAVGAFHEGVVKEVAGLRAWTEQLTGLITRVHDLPAKGPTLRAVLAERQSLKDERFSEEVTREWKVREKQLSDKLKADLLAAKVAKQQAEDRTTAVAAQDATARTDAKRVAAEQQAAAAEKHRQRLAQFHKELPDIRPQLTPFITPGKMQLGKAGWETSAEEAPLSWSALRAVLGAPGDRRGAGFLVTAFGELDTRNDRPFGSFPRRYQPDVDAAAMTRLVEFLHANGDLLVEEGLLKP